MVFITAQVGNGHKDHSYWGRPEDMTIARPAYKVTANNPGSDVVGETAAALASASIVFKKTGNNKVFWGFFYIYFARHLF